MKKVTTHQAKTQLSQPINEACNGEDIVVCRGNLPMVRLVPVERTPENTRPRVGQLTSEPVTYSDDTFAPLSDEELEVWGL